MLKTHVFGHAPVVLRVANVVILSSHLAPGFLFSRVEIVVSQVSKSWQFFFEGIIRCLIKGTGRSLFKVLNCFLYS
jgi:hypothetical protein